MPDSGSKERDRKTAVPLVLLKPCGRVSDQKAEHVTGIVFGCNRKARRQMVSGLELGSDVGIELTCDVCQLTADSRPYVMVREKSCSDLTGLQFLVISASPVGVPLG